MDSITSVENIHAESTVIPWDQLAMLAGVVGGFVCLVMMWS